MSIIDISHSEEIFTISRLNREVRCLLETSFPLIWVEGEISNFVKPPSGHWYFSLKDEISQVRGVMFKLQNRRIHFTPKDGMHVLVKARITLYEGRGDFQLIIESMEEAGIGKLQKAFEVLKNKLAQEGLFETHYKKPLPSFPTCIGIITSPTGAAIRDILHVLKRRFCCSPIIIYPTLVQGESAAANIVEALRIANERNECDVLMLARGGGSIEDLWPFNEEMVARAIFTSKIPIISGIGHEIDFTIADFVADVRAPTPSAAAELLVPDSRTLINALLQAKKQLLRGMSQTFHQSKQHLSWITKHLQAQHPKHRLIQQSQRLDYCEAMLVRLIIHKINTQNVQITNIKNKFLTSTPIHIIREQHHYLTIANHQLIILIEKLLKDLQHRFAQLVTKIDALSPLATLQRGFAIATTLESEIILTSRQVTMGEKINVQLSEGSLQCKVEKMH